RRVWSELQVPVYYYGHGEDRTLADIRAGRAVPDLGGPKLHPTAGAVCVGARRMLVAFNVILFDIDMVGARALARSIRESSAGLRKGAGELARVAVEQDAGLAGAERAAALIQVLEAAHVLDVELAGLLGAAARGLRAAVSSASEAVHRARIEALDARLV